MGTIGSLKTELSNRGFLAILVPLFLINHFFMFEKSLASPTVNNPNLNYTKYDHVLSYVRLSRIQKHLTKINKSPVFTIESPDGDIIDCVHKRKQPALDHPLLKNHTIQLVGPKMPKMMKMGTTQEMRDNSNNNSSGPRPRDVTVSQIWHKKGQRCPKGTVPIRRSMVKDVVRAKSLYDYGKKKHGMLQLKTRIDAPDIVSGNGHEHAIAYIGTSEEIYGAKATINVWNPEVEKVNEFSLSQIWVLSGSFDGSDLNSIEAGWQVSPELYGVYYQAS
ncbi:hypothetical protein Leryth_018039 [Lithospermum erythrorhizon]|nr:hypothetical protein Leryth_018039 [Lithospermum erythrorhizon]